MAESNGDWLRARGIGRERFAGYLEEYLGTVGYKVERSETSEPVETRVTAHLEKMNPAVPAAAGTVTFRFYPTSGGAAAVWEGPTTVPSDQRSRMDRFVRELESHLERAIATESHATAKVVRPPTSHFPWVVAPSPGRDPPPL